VAWSVCRERAVMRCAIMQPTYMPWAGYLNLMAHVDLFIYLDDAQYERSSWQNRNRVLVKGAPTWVTVPVVRGFLGAQINRVTVDDATPWRRKHVALLSGSYARHAHVREMLEATELLGVTSLTHLADLNIALLERLRYRLGIATPTLRSSQLGIDGVRTDRLIAILEKLGATEYVTPPGALDYLQRDLFAERTPIKLHVHDFQPAKYRQRDTEEFVSHLSVLDVVAHIGWSDAKGYIHPATKSVRAL
jgi:hypothetical protein